MDRILVINPNSTETVTQGIDAADQGLGGPQGQGRFGQQGHAL
jgi:hypothetical protein